MGFVSYVAIPINVLILLLCRFPKVPVGFFQNLDALDEAEESVMVQYLHSKDALFWNRANIILFAIFMEHIVIGLKIVMSIIIPDMPASVEKDEARREMVLKHAQEEMFKIKVSGKYETF